LSHSCTASSQHWFLLNMWFHCQMRLLGSWVRIPKGTGMFLLVSVGVVRYRSLRRADPSSRGDLPTVVCVWVWSSEK
jgi:hypothetical protein